MACAFVCIFICSMLMVRVVESETKLELESVGVDRPGQSQRQSWSQ